MSLVIDPSVYQSGCLSVSPSQQMSSLQFFQEQCLRRCIQETVSGAHFLCDRCTMEVWQLLSCSLFPSLYSPLLFSPSFQPAAAGSSSVCSYVTAAACWFIEHKRLRFDPGNTNAYTCTHTKATAASLFFSPHEPQILACVCVLNRVWLSILLPMSFALMLCVPSKTWHWAVTLQLR